MNSRSSFRASATNSDPGSSKSWRMQSAILFTANLDDSAKTTEHGVRGRRRVDCIGRMVMRPSNRGIASQPVVAFVARSSADEWDNIIPYDRNQQD